MEETQNQTQQACDSIAQIINFIKQTFIDKISIYQRLVGATLPGKVPEEDFEKCLNIVRDHYKDDEVNAKLITDALTNLRQINTESPDFEAYCNLLLMGDHIEVSE